MRIAPVLERLPRPVRLGRPVRAGGGQSARHRDDLQGLRALAVLLVVLAHSGVSHVAGGYVGVDVFFVLSGFLITGLLLQEAERDGSVSIGGFYARRVKRILPAAALTLVVTDVVANQLLNFVRAKQVMSDTIWAALFGANLRFAHEGTDYFAQSQPPSPVQHFWSLAVEEQFYVVWPTVLAITLGGLLALRWRTEDRRHQRSFTVRGGRLRLASLTSIALAASLAWSVYATRTSPASAYFSTLTRAWELALGALLAIGLPLLRRVPSAVRVIGGWGGAAAIGISAVVFSSQTAFPGYAALLPTLGAAFIIAAGASGAGGRLSVTRALSVRPMRFVGDRSYALYLWHWPALTIAAEYEGHALPVATNLAIVAGAFVLSCITYAAYEDPIRRADWSAGATGMLATACAGAAFAVAAFTIVSIGSPVDVAVAEAAVAPVASPGASADAAFNQAVQQARTPVAASDAVAQLVRSSANATGSVPVASLRPSIESLLNDHYVFPGGCSAHDGQSRSTLCRLGDASARRSLVVFGDSHAQMWMPAILAMATRDHWAVIPIDKSACSPAKWTTAVGSDDCHAWFPWALASLRKLRPDVVLVAGAYAGSGVTEELAAASGFARVAHAARGASRSVVVMLDAPGEQQQPIDCLLQKHATLQACSLNRIASGRAENDAKVADAVGSLPGVGVIDPSDWFCDQEICPMVIGDTIAYVDTGHVTATYALELAGPFRAAFQRASLQTG